MNKKEGFDSDCGGNAVDAPVIVDCSAVYKVPISSLRLQVQLILSQDDLKAFMGACFSVPQPSKPTTPSLTAKLISVNGDLREYNLPATVSQVLHLEASFSSSSASFESRHFICNCDSLFYDAFIPPMKLDELLQGNQIYFVLPESKRQSCMSATDMAALAVKASLALEAATGKESRRGGKSRISPVMMLNPSDTKTRVTPPVSRSGSVRRLQRYASRRTKLAVRSFRLRLSTIYEGSVL